MAIDFIHLRRVTCDNATFGGLYRGGGFRASHEPCSISLDQRQVNMNVHCLQWLDIMDIGHWTLSQVIILIDRCPYNYFFPGSPSSQGRAAVFKELHSHPLLPTQKVEDDLYTARQTVSICFHMPAFLSVILSNILSECLIILKKVVSTFNSGQALFNLLYYTQFLCKVTSAAVATIPAPSDPAPSMSASGSSPSPSVCKRQRSQFPEAFKWPQVFTDERAHQGYQILYL